MKADPRMLQFLAQGYSGNNLTQLAPGVLGIEFEQEDGRVFIPMIIAEREGSGDVGRYLDSLDSKHVIICCMEPVLMGMLARRGFIPSWESDGMGGETDVWKR